MTRTRTSLMDLAREKVIVLDGAMGTTLQQYDLGPVDFAGLEGCNEILVETRPEVLREVHAGYFEAGCDVVETNTFGANGVVLAEYGIAGRTLELNRVGARLARETADDFATRDRPRFVLGSVGPGTRLPTLGHITWDDLHAAFLPQFQGLLQGGVDALCIETCQDLLQVRVAIDAAREAFRTEARSVPIFVSLTIESTGTMLVGSDVQTALTALRPLGIDVLGLNCATGPTEMQRHVEHLSEHGPAHLMAMPNAGLPENVEGRIVYSLTPGRFADLVGEFVTRDGIGIVGGCCGTTKEHLAALVARVGNLPAPQRRVAARPAALSSLFQAVSLRQEPAPLMVGERTNANGSRAFRERLLANDQDGMLDVGREQARGGAHLLDVSVAYVGRDEAQDMTRFVARLVRTNRLPLCIDSTDAGVMEAALKLAGGRCLLNSVNLEEGEEKLHRVAALAQRHGAALIALAIDEQGMAMTRERKLEVAERILTLCTRDHGLEAQDLVFDMLTFTVGSGDPATRRSAVETLEALTEFKQRHPEAHTLLGISNVSYGLKPAARRVLNSVFLHLAVDRGLDQAIVNARGILPLYRIDETLRAAATRLLLDDHSAGDPLAAYLALFADDKAPGAARMSAAREKLPPDRAVHQMVVDGISKGLPRLLDGLVEQGHKPVDIINELLIGAMKEVGDLFGSGQMQLPFVLQSAEVMKAAVGHLEQYLEAADQTARGTLVLATVKGDVHDIGKNLVDIIVSNNGFRVVNIGTKIEVEEMLRVAQAEDALAIGMSGLLVKSTVIMRENLLEMQRRGLSYPVLLGGAALTRDYVEADLRALYGPHVHYCLDAFEGLRVMTRLAEGKAPGTGAKAAPEGSASSRRGHRGVPGAGDNLPPPPIDRAVVIPTPPFTGRRVLDRIPLEEVFGLLNERALFRGQWRYRRGRMTREEYETLTRDHILPTLSALKVRVEDERLFQPRAVYGYYPCMREGRTLTLLGPDDSVLTQFEFPRKASPPHHCIADYFVDESAPRRDVLGLFVVTIGESAVAEVQRLYHTNRYQDYLHLHGLAVECAEATAEWLHQHMRRELDIAAEDQGGHEALARQGYRGSRYSFGYAACPNLDDQDRLFSLLDPSVISVSLTESMQMVPEYSVSALVVHHPQAKYFNLE